MAGASVNGREPWATPRIAVSGSEGTICCLGSLDLGGGAMSAAFPSPQVTNFLALLAP
jgi:hypothetical protein